MIERDQAAKQFEELKLVAEEEDDIVVDDENNNNGNKNH